MEWQPIESAPKDGTNMLLACVDGDYPLTGYFFMNGFYGIESDLLWPQPTHWMPLPAPPTEADAS